MAWILRSTMAAVSLQKDTPGLMVEDTLAFSSVVLPSSSEESLEVALLSTASLVD